MTAARSVPARPPAARRPRPRFDKARATLALLLLSGAVLGLSALKQARPGLNRLAQPSIWNGSGGGTDDHRGWGRR